MIAHPTSIIMVLSHSEWVVYDILTPIRHTTERKETIPFGTHYLVV